MVMMMGKFHDAIGSWAPDAELPDDWRDQLSAAYDEDFEGANIKTNELNEALEASQTASAAEIAGLKSANYDLLMQIPKDNTNSTDDTNTVDDNENVDITIDDLFGDA